MNDRVCQLRIEDGRDHAHARSIESLEQMLPEPHEIVVVDDREHRLGFHGAIAEGWRKVREAECDWVWHAELDFVYLRPVPIAYMQAVMRQYPYLLQMSLKRQPVNDHEIAHGGWIEGSRERGFEFTERSHPEWGAWIQHRCIFTTNPCLYRAALCELGWPQESDSEGKFTHRLVEDPAIRFAVWGRISDPPMVEHIGVRMGVGY